MPDKLEPTPDDLMTTGESARVLGLSADTVRWLKREGRVPAQRTTNGVRLFRRGDVERLAAERASAAGKEQQSAAPATRAGMAGAAEKRRGGRGTS